jgi:transcriptional regulator with XRE-family HTH domain
MSINPVVPLRLRVPEWTFAERLRKARRDLKLTQAHMSAQLDVKPSTYEAWETGRNTPDVATLAPKLEEITGISRLWFIGWAGDAPTGGGNSQDQIRSGVLRSQGNVTSITRVLANAA